MLDIKTYWHSFFIDDTSKIYIDGAADTIDHFGFNDVYIKGGEFRRWYGNTELVVNWENDGYAIRHYKGSTIRNQNYFKKEAVTWTLLSSKSGISARYVRQNAMFDNNGSSAFPKDNQEALLGFLNSKVANECLTILNPTLAFQVGNIAS